MLWRPVVPLDFPLAISALRDPSKSTLEREQLNLGGSSKRWGPPGFSRNEWNQREMALIKTFVHRPGATIAFRSEVDCGYSVGTVGDRRILHLETYGSRTRAIPGKVSQS